MTYPNNKFIPPVLASKRINRSTAYFSALRLSFKTTKKPDLELKDCFNARGWIDLDRFLEIAQKRRDTLEKVSYYIDFFKEKYSLSYAYNILPSPPFKKTVFYSGVCKIVNYYNIVPHYTKFKKWEKVLQQWENIEEERYKKEFERWIEED